MNRLHLLLQSVLLAVACSATGAPAQLSAPAHLSIDEQARHAGLIFAGIVTSIDRSENSSIAQISFRVTDGIRGVNSDQTVTLREWTGTWNGQSRYRTGEKVVAFFHATDANGFTSPVGGSAGIFRFANDSTLKFSAAQQAGVMRSIRLRDSLGFDPSQPPKTASAIVFLRALRLFVDSP